MERTMIVASFPALLIMSTTVQAWAMSSRASITHQTAKLSVDHLNNSDLAKKASYLWLYCDSHSIEPNYFERTNNTFALTTGSTICYKCSLLIDATNCSIYHAAVTKLIPVNCQDVQIVLQVPDRVRTTPDLSQSVHENARQVQSDSPGFDKYVVWLNISHFSPYHQGDYTFIVQTLPEERTLFDHRVTLLPVADRKSSKPTQNEFSHSSTWCSASLHTLTGYLCQVWLTLGLISASLVFLAICLFAFRRIYSARKLNNGITNANSPQL